MPAGSDSAVPTLSFYTRAGCHLCEQAHANLIRLAFRVTVLDVDSRDDWRQKYGNDVPVLALGEQVLARGVLSPARLGMIKLRLLREAGEGPQEDPEPPIG